MSMITNESLHRLIDLKTSDRQKFLERLEEMAAESADVLLSFKRFKEYPANV